jgi:hypothetical protein
MAAVRGFDSLLDRLLSRFTTQATNIDQRPGSALAKQVGMETDLKGRIPLHMACARGMIVSIIYNYLIIFRSCSMCTYIVENGRSKS